MPLTPSDLAERLAAAGVPFELLETKEETPSVETAAAALGVAPDDIVKSVVFADKGEAGRFVLVLARGRSRVDVAKLAAVVPGRWRLATPAEVESVTGYAAGTVPPVAHATRVPAIMDARVESMERLVGGGAGARTSLRIRREDVTRLTGCVVADVALERAS